MSLAGFATLRAKHPGDQTVQAIEKGLSDLLRRYPDGVVEDRSVATAAALDPAVVEPYLVELVEAGALRTRFFWICPEGKGVSDEEDDLAVFPDEIECEPCGKVHYYSQSDIEVAFLPTPELQHSAHPDETV